MMNKTRMRDLVIVVPGIMGSVLEKTGRGEVWSASAGATWRALSSGGASLRELAICGDDTGADDLGDGIYATRLIHVPYVIAGLMKCDGYRTLRNMITDVFDVTVGTMDAGDREPANYLEFPYDWRRDNRVIARKLKACVDERLESWRKSASDRANAKVIFIAHSMGGLVCRYYTEVLGGWRKCRALITVGTPHRGSVGALEYLSRGYKSVVTDLTDVVRTFPSIYQLLPIYPMLDREGKWLRIATSGSIPGVVEERARKALAFHRTIERAVRNNRRREADLDGYQTIPVVGTRQPTLQSAAFVRGLVETGWALPTGTDALLEGGDGTVPRASAIPIELSGKAGVFAIAERHAFLQSNRIVLAWLRDILLQVQVQNLTKLRASPPEARAEIGLALDDAYPSDRPIILKATIHGSEPAGAKPVATIEPIEPRGNVVQDVFRATTDGWELRVEGLNAGLYRIHVEFSGADPDQFPPVHDLFSVESPAPSVA